MVKVKRLKLREFLKSVMRIDAVSEAKAIIIANYIANNYRRRRKEK